MLGEGKQDSETIMMRKAQTAENGISFTLNEFSNENDTVRLQSDYPKMKAVKVPAEKVHIEGDILISIRRWK